MKRLLGRSCLPLALLLGCGCSWSRFDDITENAPIVLLNRPEELANGFATSLATGTYEDPSSGETRVTLLVGGAPLVGGGAEFELGTADSPTLDATDRGHCLNADPPTPCYFSSSPVALTGTSSPGKERPLCFVDGAGTAAGDPGVVVRCYDEVEYALDVPADVAELLEFSINRAQPTQFRFGADHGAAPTLLATADEEDAVWFYPALDSKRRFVEIPYPAESRGRWPEVTDVTSAHPPNARNLTVARVGEARLLVVGIPDLSEVRLFLSPDGHAAPSYLGCLGGTPGFGRSFATGKLLADDPGDVLVIADESLVYVFSATELATLLPTTQTGCSLAALPPSALVTSFTCGSSKNLSGCAGSEFGAAVGVGDLDGDGDGEVVVGAPRMKVRDIDGAGALLIYDVEERADFDFLDILFMSSAEKDDQLGRAIALPDLGKRQIIAAGATGNGKTALFYCPSFLPGHLAGDRCN
ncbi:MAG TPA: hypothetical protein VIW29_20355 [Polyangiaceae bacterium]